jgi:K+-sensing histidine kinase KdpD
MSDGVFAVDTDWRVTYANEFGTEVLANAMGRELTPEEIEGFHLWEEIPEAVDTVFYEKYHQALDTQEPVTFEEYYEPLEVWFDVRAYPSETGLSVYLYDITERYRQREAAERRERVLRRMYEIISDRDREFVDQVEALLEFGRTELDTQYGTLSRIDGEDYHFEVVTGEDDSIQSGDVGDLSATNCELVASNEEAVVLGDVERDAPEETDRAGFTEWGIACYIGAPVYVDEGVYGTFCFYDTDPRDGEFSGWEQTVVELMSRWVSYELQRQRATEQLEAKNEQLEAKNEQLEGFAKIISHDLRNPLEVLDGWLDMAQETGEQDAFDRCFDAVDRMETLIDEILTLAQAGSVIDDPEPVEIEIVATKAWETVDTPEATLDIDTDHTVDADPTRLQQLFENLFRNSIEHGGETVTVTVGALSDGFYVEDDGDGFAGEAEDIFESGYSTADDGTGFGLAIVREVANAHGWELTATAGTDGGARFECRGVDAV